MSDIWKQFEENKITHSAAHHLIAVYELKKSKGYARVTDVANFLNITAGSASINLKNLKHKGLIVEDENKFLSLSPKAEKLVKSVLARKRIFKKFLTDVLGVSEEQAEIDACKTEHLLSHETSEKLLNLINLLSSEGENLNLLSIRSKLSSSTFCCSASSGAEEPATKCTVCEDHCLVGEC